MNSSTKPDSSRIDVLPSAGAQLPVRSRAVSRELRTVLVERLSDARSQQADFSEADLQSARQIYFEDAVRMQGTSRTLIWATALGLVIPNFLWFFAGVGFFVGLAPFVALPLLTYFGIRYARRKHRQKFDSTSPGEQVVRIQSFYINQARSNINKERAKQRGRIQLAIVLVVAILAFATVPGRDKHEQAIRQAVQDSLKSNERDTADDAARKFIISSLLGPDGVVNLLNLKYADAYVVSWMSVKHADLPPEIVSWGIFGRVWVNK